jgi:hypothetical protein
MKSVKQQVQPGTRAPAQTDGLAQDLGMQASHGNAFIQEQLAAAGKLGGKAAEAVQEREEPDQPVGMLYIRTSFENGDLPEQLQAMGERQVGHTWIAYVPMDGAEWVFDGFTQGFFPVDGFSVDPRVDVPGMVVDPEPYDGSQTAELGFWVNESQLLEAVRYANANAARPYNLYSYNCTDYALGVLDAASIPKPSIGILGVDFPMALQQSLPLVEGAGEQETGQ